MQLCNSCDCGAHVNQTFHTLTKCRVCSFGNSRVDSIAKPLALTVYLTARPKIRYLTLKQQA